MTLIAGLRGLRAWRDLAAPVWALAGGWIGVVPGLLLAAAVVATLASIGPLPNGLLLLGVLAYCAVPGVTVARMTGCADRRDVLRVAPAAAVWGVATSLLALLALWTAGVRAWWLLLASPLLATAVMTPLRGTRLPVAFARLGRRDVPALLLVLLSVPAIVGVPYAHVGLDTPGGRAYRAYFTADLIWAKAVVAEVAKGEVPPANPYYHGDTLHYYWLSHLLSAAEYRHLRPVLDSREVILPNALGFSLLFASFLYFFVRQFVARPAAAALACLAVMLASSYEGVFQAGDLWWRGRDLDRLRDVNIDALTRWRFNGMPIDGLHRLMMYQSHHLVGYATSLSALLLTARATDPRSPRLAAAVAALLGVALLASSFTAIVVGCAVAAIWAARSWRPQHWTSALACAAAAAVPVILAVGASRFFGYVDAGDIVRFGPNPRAVRLWPLVFALSFGPLLIVGLGGAVVAVRARARGLLPIVALAGVAALFYFLVDVPDHQGVYVGWRTGHLMFVALTVLVGLAVQALLNATVRVRAVLGGCALLVCLAGVPTTAIDVYNAQDIANDHEGPGFPWTLTLSHDELDALEWIRERTPERATVQVEATVRGTRHWAYIPAFADRRMAAGLPISMVPIAKYVRRRDLVRERVYNAPDAEHAHANAARLGIDYLVIGAPERVAYFDLEPRLRRRPDLFPLAFENEAMTIFRVRAQPD